MNFKCDKKRHDHIGRKVIQSYINYATCHCSFHLSFSYSISFTVIFLHKCIVSNSNFLMFSSFFCFAFLCSSHKDQFPFFIFSYNQSFKTFSSIFIIYYSIPGRVTFFVHYIFNITIKLMNYTFYNLFHLMKHIIKLYFSSKTFSNILLIAFILLEGEHLTHAGVLFP